MTQAMDIWLFLALALPFVAAVLAPLAANRLGGAAGLVLAVFPAVCLAIFAGQAGAVVDGQAVLWGVDWVPSLGIRFSFRLDGLSFVFALLITGIGILVVIYSGGYLAGRPDLGRFFAFILLFMGAMLGLVLADDLMTLIVAWEMTSIASFLLIGFDHARAAARRGAVQALVITGGGGLALLAGLILIRLSAGVSSLTELIGAGHILHDSVLYGPILILVLCGAFTKSAQMPFHVWLPNAMEAPTPVSAYLHSATMVKAGVYLLLRLNPAFGETLAWETILSAFGAVTLLLGALLALRQSDLKLMLAYTTIASLGLIVMLIGIGTPAAIEAAVLYLVAHSLFKGALFMAVGAIDHGAGTRDVGLLGGLRGTMPFTFAAALLAALSMGGVTPFFGFIAKEAVYEATAASFGADAILLSLAALVANALMVAAAFLVALKPFAGTQPAGLDRAHETAAIWSGALMLGVLGILAGLFSETVHRLFSGPMASAALGHDARIEISALPHLTLAFAMSLATILLGAAVYLKADRVRNRMAGVLGAIAWGPDRGFDQAMRCLVLGAVALTRVLQGGRLDRYITTAFAVVALALFGAMAFSGGWPALTDGGLAPPRFNEWLIVATLILGLIAVVGAKSRLTAIVSLGIQGFAVALIFMLMGAPDLSFTQFMVETLSVVILALVMTRLKLSPDDHRPLRETLPDIAIAITGGIGFGLLLLAVTQRPFDATMTAFFERHSYAIAHGRNIVNVILVDFRGIDTLGEITVVLTTGLAVLALIRIRIRRGGTRIPDPEETTP